ncbi:MAG: ABC transporter substrate-binding protein [Candidatus Coprovivens sp.]
MKNFFIIIASFLIITIAFVYIKNNDKKDVVKVAEVTHSIFYAPLYVAIENGYFEDEGLNIDLILVSGADKVAAAVLSGDVQIGFAGPESAIYVYKNGEKDYLQCFAGLTKRDGQFIVSRTKDDNFKLEDLYGKEILVGRSGGMPALNFLNGMKNNNMNINNININTSIDFANLTGTFLSGIGDYVNLFEPNALKLEKEGLGYVVGSVGQLSGEMPYTAFYSRKSYIENNKDTIKRFNKALNRGINYVKKHNVVDIAKVISNQFTDIELNDIEKIVQRYKDNDSWFDNTTIEQDYYINLENIMIDNNLLDEYVPFDELVINLNE